MGWKQRTGCRPRRVVADLADGGLAWPPGGRVPGGVALNAHALEGEGRPGALSDEPLAAC